MWAVLARIVGYSAAGWVAGDVLNWFQLKRQTGVEPAPFGKTMLAVFTSRGFVLFMVVIIAGFFLLVKGRLKKTR